jgi:hypothetical protein
MSGFRVSFFDLIQSVIIDRETTPAMIPLSIAGECWAEDGRVLEEQRI